MPSDDEFPPALVESLEKIIKKEGYVTYNVVKKPISTKGIGFLARPFLVTIEGMTKHGDKQMNVYVKSALPEESTEDILDMVHLYDSEAFAYNNLYEIFTELQDQAGISTADRFKMIKSYGVSNSNGIFLENVAIKGYQCFPRTATITLQVAELAIKEIAKFHAFSFIIREKRPDYYERIENIKTPIYFGERFEAIALSMGKIAIKHLKEDSQLKMQSFMENYVEKFKNYSLGENVTTRCLCHGDFRLHNLLVKQMGEELDLFVVDYQLMSMNSPVNDLLYFLFIGTDGQFRKKHFEHIKHLYYDTFTKFLKKFDIDSAKVYPRREYEKDFREKLDYGLTCALYFLPFMLADENEIPHPEDFVSGLDFKVDESFPERFQDIVDDYVEWGVL